MMLDEGGAGGRLLRWWIWQKRNWRDKAGLRSAAWCALECQVHGGRLEVFFRKLLRQIALATDLP